MQRGLAGHISDADLAALARFKDALGGDAGGDPSGPGGAPGDSGDPYSEGYVAETAAGEPEADDSWVDGEGEGEERDAGEVLTDDEVSALFQALTDEDFAEVDRWMDEAERRGFDSEYDLWLAEEAERQGDLEAAAKHRAAAARAVKEGGADRNRGGAEKLRRYWTVGEGGAKIRWGTGGDFTRCVKYLSKHLGARAKGYCALRHKEMNGFWPGSKLNKARRKPADEPDVRRTADDQERDYVRNEDGEFASTGRSDSAIGAVRPDGSYDPAADIAKYGDPEEGSGGGGSSGGSAGAAGEGEAEGGKGERDAGDGKRDSDTGERDKDDPKRDKDDPKPGGDPKNGDLDLERVKVGDTTYDVRTVRDLRQLVDAWDEVPRADRRELRRALADLALERDDVPANLLRRIEDLPFPGQRVESEIVKPGKPKDREKSAPRPRPRERKDAGMQMEHKVVPVVGQKVLDDEKGIVETIVSVTGAVDEVDDNILPGAYEKTLTQRTPKGVWGHDWMTPVSRTLMVKELMPGDPELPTKTRTGEPWPAGAGGLKVRTQFNLETQRGRDAYSDVKFFGDEQEWSIGYQVPVGGSKMNQKTGVREIATIDLYEYSPVLFGAMPLAHTSSVKSAQETLAMLKSGGRPTATNPAPTPAQLAAREEERQAAEKAAAGARQQRKDVWVEVEGSVEDRMRAVRDAVDAQYPTPDYDAVAPSSVWAHVQATWPDRVLWQVHGEGHDREEFWEAPYSVVDGNVVLGTPKRVTVSATVEPFEVEGPMVDGVLGAIAGVEKSLARATESKVGRVLSASNVAALEQACQAIQQVLDAHSSRMAPPSEETVAEKRAALDVEFKERDYVRDARGRFASIGAVVDLLDVNPDDDEDGKGKIIGVNANGTAKVEKSDGSVVDVDPKGIAKSDDQSGASGVEAGRQQRADVDADKDEPAASAPNSSGEEDVTAGDDAAAGRQAQAAASVAAGTDAPNDPTAGGGEGPRANLPDDVNALLDEYADLGSGSGPEYNERLRALNARADELGLKRPSPGNEQSFRDGNAEARSLRNPAVDESPYKPGMDPRESGGADAGAGGDAPAGPEGVSDRDFNGSGQPSRDLGNGVHAQAAKPVSQFGVEVSPHMEYYDNEGTMLGIGGFDLWGSPGQDRWWYQPDGGSEQITAASQDDLHAKIGERHGTQTPEASGGTDVPDYNEAISRVRDWEGGTRGALDASAKGDKDATWALFDAGLISREEGNATHGGDTDWYKGDEGFGALRENLRAEQAAAAGEGGDAPEGGDNSDVPEGYEVRQNEDGKWDAFTAGGMSLTEGEGYDERADAVTTAEEDAETQQSANPDRLASEQEGTPEFTAARGEDEGGMDARRYDAMEGWKIDHEDELVDLIGQENFDDLPDDPDEMPSALRNQNIDPRFGQEIDDLADDLEGAIRKSEDYEPNRPPYHDGAEFDRWLDGASDEEVEAVIPQIRQALSFGGDETTRDSLTSAEAERDRRQQSNAGGDTGNVGGLSTELGTDAPEGVDPDEPVEVDRTGSGEGTGADPDAGPAALSDLPSGSDDRVDATQRLDWQGAARTDDSKLDAYEYPESNDARESLRAVETTLIGGRRSEIEPAIDQYVRNLEALLDELDADNDEAAVDEIQEVLDYWDEVLANLG